MVVPGMQPLAQVGSRTDAGDTHDAHQAPDALSVDGAAVLPHFCRNPAIAVERFGGIDFIDRAQVFQIYLGPYRAPWRPVNAGSVDAEQCCLMRQADPLVSGLGHGLPCFYRVI